jgi:hypothetical protein
MDQQYNKTELETRKKIAEINKEVSELKRQIAEIQDNKSNQFGNNLCAGKIQVQPEPTTIDGTYNISELNANCVIGSVETGCTIGVHVSSSHTHTRLSVSSCTHHVIPEIAPPTIGGLTQNAVQFVKDMDDYCHCKSVGDTSYLK